MHGTRYNQETLQIKYKDKNIAEVLDMTVEQLGSFLRTNKIESILKTLMDVGLGYIKLGCLYNPIGKRKGSNLQVNLKRITDPDEPTTSLHAYDVKKLLEVINKIVDEGYCHYY